MSDPMSTEMRDICSTAWSGALSKTWLAVSVLSLVVLMLAGCTRSDYSRTSNQRVPTSVEPRLLVRPLPPNCKVKGVKPPVDSDAPGANADPKLLELARLEIERDCYKRAERISRRRLKKLQRSIGR